MSPTHQKQQKNHIKSQKITNIKSSMSCNPEAIELIETSPGMNLSHPSDDHNDTSLASDVAAVSNHHVGGNVAQVNYTFFFYKKPRVRGSGSAFLRNPEFESQKFLKLIKIPVFSFLKFLQFEPPIFLRFCVKNIIRTKILAFWSKSWSSCIKC